VCPVAGRPKQQGEPNASPRVHKAEADGDINNTSNIVEEAEPNDGGCSAARWWEEETEPCFQTRRALKRARRDRWSEAIVAIYWSQAIIYQLQRRGRHLSVDCYLPSAVKGVSCYPLGPWLGMAVALRGR
jgi:hypothetical protein